MNKRHKKGFRLILVVVCLITVLLVQQVGQVLANSTGQVTTTVSNFSQLYSAMIQAQDGDVIGISGTITMSASSTVGYTDKHITLKRMSSSSYFNIGSESTFQNLTFDGGGISASNAYVITNGKVTFQDVTFQNSLNNGSGGGAVHVINNTAYFNNCTFDNNTAVEGGHIFVNNSSTVNINDSIMKNGHASISGGAIMNSYYEATTNITNSVITENSADKHGGGISNRGMMKITGTKIFDNTAPNGADIANVAYGNLNLADSVQTLVELFKDDGIIPKGWINDYDGSTLSDSDINPTAANSLLKLDYEIPPIAVVLDSSSLGTAGNGKITGLEAGKKYKVTVDGSMEYVKSDGTLTANESEVGSLTGTEILGLVNGKSYLVEEYISPIIEEPTTPVDPGNETPTEQPTDPGSGSNTSTNTSTTTNNTSTTTTSNNNNTSTTNSTTDNSSSNTTNNSDSSSTVNNYSYDYSTHTKTENSVPPSNNGQATAPKEQIIRIDTGNLKNELLKVQQDGKEITININVNVKNDDPKDAKAEESVQVSASPVQTQPENISWVEMVKICLLFGILICVIRKPSIK
jgi:hypothetical protein